MSEMNEKITKEEFLNTLRDRAIDPVSRALRFVPPEDSDLECAGPAEWGAYSFLKTLEELMLGDPRIMYAKEFPGELYDNCTEILWPPDTLGDEEIFSLDTCAGKGDRKVVVCVFEVLDEKERQDD